jgi:hypothetical protein
MIFVLLVYGLDHSLELSVTRSLLHSDWLTVFTCSTAFRVYITCKIAVAYKFHATRAKLSRGVQILCTPRIRL